ncbi:hypothetical protein KC366_g9 [Hortaea werneckii]|nr:hypothetical protein KC366_g9 [Hortaea werneckii]
MSTKAMEKSPKGFMTAEFENSRQSKTRRPKCLDDREILSLATARVGSLTFTPNVVDWVDVPLPCSSGPAWTVPETTDAALKPLIREVCELLIPRRRSCFTQTRFPCGEATPRSAWGDGRDARVSWLVDFRCVEGSEQFNQQRRTSLRPSVGAKDRRVFNQYKRPGPWRLVLRGTAAFEQFHTASAVLYHAHSGGISKRHIMRSIGFPAVIQTIQSYVVTDSVPASQWPRFPLASRRGGVVSQALVSASRSLSADEKPLGSMKTSSSVTSLASRVRRGRVRRSLQRCLVRVGSTVFCPVDRRTALTLQDTLPGISGESWELECMRIWTAAFRDIAKLLGEDPREGDVRLQIMVSSDVTVVLARASFLKAQLPVAVFQGGNGLAKRLGELVIIHLIVVLEYKRRPDFKLPLNTMLCHDTADCFVAGSGSWRCTMSYSLPRTFLEW